MYLKVGPLLILGGYVGVSLFNDQIDSTAFESDKRSRLL